MAVDIFKLLQSEDGNYSIVVLQTIDDTFVVIEESQGVDICWEYETLAKTLEHYIEFVEAHKEVPKPNN